MPIQKDPELSDVCATNGTKTQEFEHNGRKIIVEYVKPTVSMINEARDQAMVISQKGRAISYRLKIFDFEVNLLLRCLKDSNIPGIPQTKDIGLRNINDPELWNKLLVACEIKDAEVKGDELEILAQEAVDALGTDHPAMAALAVYLKKTPEEAEAEDVKK